MQELNERILRDGRNLGKGIIRVDSFLNHQIDSVLIMRIGEELARRLKHTHPTKVLTAEISGIAPALTTAIVLGVPLVFARKNAPVTMGHTTFKQSTKSHTHGKTVELVVSEEFLKRDDRVLIIDDFLATAQTILALTGIVEQAKAQLVGIGAAVEKSFENGRKTLSHIRVPIETLSVITSMDDGKIILQSDPNDNRAEIQYSRSGV